MKWKNMLIASAAALAIAGAIAGCGGDKKEAAASAAPKNEIVVGINPGYSEKVMEFVTKEADKQGLKVIVKSFSDYVTPDQALASKEIDVNSMQHKPFLDAFNEKNGTTLISIGNTYLAPLRLYSYKVKDVKDIPDGATIAIPNDPSNGGRALLLLQRQGLLKLRDGVEATKVTVQDIASNPKNLQIVELEAPQLPRSLDDTAASVVNAGYAKDAGLKKESVIATEDNTSPYVNIIAARAEDKDNPTYKKFVQIFQSEPVKKFIIDNTDGNLVPAF